jgi:hypothetical protein
MSMVANWIFTASNGCQLDIHSQQWLPTGYSQSAKVANWLFTASIGCQLATVAFFTIKGVCHRVLSELFDDFDNQ